MRKLANWAYRTADMAYGWSLIVVGASIMGVSLLMPHL